MFVMFQKLCRFMPAWISHGQDASAHLCLHSPRPDEYREYRTQSPVTIVHACKHLVGLQAVLYNHLIDRKRALFPRTKL